MKQVHATRKTEKKTNFNSSTVLISILPTLLTEPPQFRERACYAVR